MRTTTISKDLFRYLFPGYTEVPADVLDDIQNSLLKDGDASREILSNMKTRKRKLSLFGSALFSKSGSEDSREECSKKKVHRTVVEDAAPSEHELQSCEMLFDLPLPAIEKADKAAKHCAYSFEDDEEPCDDYRDVLTRPNSPVLEEPKDSGIRFSVRSPKPSPAERAAAQKRDKERELALNEEFSSERLIAELSKKRVEELKAFGLSQEAIDFILNSDYKLSRLHINRHGKILLTDYDNEEIKLYPKDKALFFLFLRHPEGINQKNLADHKRELMDLYLSVCKSSDVYAARQTVERLVDPFSNEANSSITKIKTAFLKLHRDAISKNYYVVGKRGDLRSIGLDRNLVTWDTIR